MHLLYGFIIFLFSSSCLFAGVKSTSVRVVAGNIYYAQGAHSDIQLTHSGHDHDPVLSADKKHITFIRMSNEVIPKDCRSFSNTSTSYGEQIWIVDIEHKKERLLVNHHFSYDKPTEMIIDPNHLAFSPDGKTLYFLTSAWVTSGAVHAVNIESAKQHYLLPANSLEVVADGEYKGDLIVNQHRYFIGGSSYDWYWLFTPESKEIGPLGEESSIK